MEAWSPFATKEGASILGREYDVVMKAEECRAHGSWPFWHPSGVRLICAWRSGGLRPPVTVENNDCTPQGCHPLAPLRGAEYSRVVFRWSATTGYFRATLRVAKNVSMACNPTILANRLAGQPFGLQIDHTTAQQPGGLRESSRRSKRSADLRSRINNDCTPEGCHPLAPLRGAEHFAPGVSVVCDHRLLSRNPSSCKSRPPVIFVPSGCKLTTGTT